jgi:hypothetical protein
VLPLRSVPFSPGSSFQIVDLQRTTDSPAGQQAWAGFESTMEKFWETAGYTDHWKRTEGHFLLWREPEVKIGGAAFRFPVVNAYIRPVLLTADTPEVTIPIDQECTTLHILGQVSFPQGYPVTGKYGEQIAVYSLQYDSGRTQDLPVRNGIEVVQANRIYVATRIEPVATAAQPALHFVKDVAREQYQVLLLSVSVEGSNKLTRLRCTLHGRQAPLAIFAITTERAAG